MKNILAIAAAAAALTALSISPSFAKGHDQGFGNRSAGPMTAGKVDDTQSNRDGTGSESSYGKTDASLEAKDGTQDNSERARDRDNASHPSNK